MCFISFPRPQILTPPFSFSAAFSILKYLARSSLCFAYFSIANDKNVDYAFFFALIAFGSLVLIAVDYVGLKGIGETFIMVVRLC